MNGSSDLILQALTLFLFDFMFRVRILHKITLVHIYQKYAPYL